MAVLTQNQLVPRTKSLSGDPGKAEMARQSFFRLKGVSRARQGDHKAEFVGGKIQIVYQPTGRRWEAFDSTAIGSHKGLAFREIEAATN